MEQVTPQSPTKPNELPEYKIPPRERLCLDIEDCGVSYYTQGMFINFKCTQKWLKNPCTPTFTRAEYDHDGYYSFYKLYMQYDSDYEAAIGILGSWSHWLELCKAPWFAVMLEKWQEEREVRDRAHAKATLIKAARNGDIRGATEVNNLYKREGAGRPSRKEKETEARKASAVEKKLFNIVDRMEQRKA